MLATRNFTNKNIHRWRIKGWKKMHYKKWFSLDNDTWAEVSGGTLCQCVYVCVIMKCRCMCVGIYVKARQEFTLMSLLSGLIHLGILEIKTLSHCDHPSWYSWDKGSHCDLRLIDSARLTGLRAPRIHLPQLTQHLDDSHVSAYMPFFNVVH